MNIDLMAIATAMAVIIGVVNGIALFDNAYSVGQPPRINSFAKFLIAMVLGIVFGALHWFGLESIQIGLVAALASSGLYKIAQVL